MKRLWLGLLLVNLGLAVAWSQPTGKFDLVFVGAHPDDDSTATACLARYASLGKRVAVITATRGEQGGNLVGPEGGAALGLIRESEEREALGQLGIQRVYYLGAQDSGFTTSLQVSQRNWGRAQVLAQLIRLFRLLQPTVVITMSPGPRGHGDHQCISQWATEAFFRAGTLPTDGEGLPAWTASRLYYSLEYGSDGLEPSLTVPAGEWGERERQALSHYRSQGWDRGLMPPQGDETFWLAVDRTGSAHSHSDMLEGTENPPRQAPPQVRAAPEVELERTPALQNFLAWSRCWGLSLESLAPPTRTVEAGQPFQWPLRYSTPPAREGAAVLSLQAPLAAGPHPLSLRVGPTLQPATLQVVPGLQVADSHWSSWQDVNRLWEGKCSGDVDASARFRLRSTRQTLEVEVEVRDDHLVADLPASENRAHWRTDAVEIAVDPEGTSADTTTTFKLGVIARNAEGSCMAARDADAHPGPWTHPIQCQIRPGGYSVRLTIPQSELPRPLKADFSFNLLLYDHDPGQPPCRLAWSAWETVQGWPELWGRVHVR